MSVCHTGRDCPAHHCRLDVRMMPLDGCSLNSSHHAVLDPCMCALQQVGANAALALLLTVGTNLLGIFTM